MRLVLPLLALCLLAVQVGAQDSFQGKIQVSTPTPEQVAKPQKMISYPLSIQNVGPVRTVVVFELVEQPKGDWKILLPESVAIETGQSAATTVAVSTPYDTGYNDGSARFVLRAIPTSPDDPSAQGEPQDIELGAKVKGWYAPGPSGGLVLAILAIAAFVRARSTR